MSGYSYNDAGQVNGQPYPQYNAYGQYPAQNYQAGMPQYNSLPAAANGDLTYVPMTGIMPQNSADLDGVTAYQDYQNVYGANDANYGQSQHTPQSQQQLPQHSYDSPQESGMARQQLQNAGSYNPMSQIQIPVPHLPKQSSYPANRPLNTGIPTAGRRIAAAPSNPPVAPIPTPTPAAVQSARQSPVNKRAKPGPKRNASRKPVAADDELESEDEDDYMIDGIKTKSGRKVHKPTQFSPALKTGSKRRGAGAVKKTAVDSLFCKVCDRGHFPKSNLIVFCDGCNTPYHQLCHVPVIDNLLITLPDAEWFCASCDEKRGQRKLEMGYSGSNLTEEQKKSYLAGLPTSHLVQLVLHAASAHPELGLFSPNAATILHKVHLKHEAAILEERAKMAPIPIATQATKVSKSPPPVFNEASLEGQIFRALSAASRPIRNQDIIAFIEATYVIDPQTFREKCAAEIDRLVTEGRLNREGNVVSMSKDGASDPGKSVQSNSVKSTATKVTNRAEKSANTKAVMLEAEGQGFVNEQYPRVEGIKLPPENPETDGFSMQETESPAFVHVRPN